MQVEMHVYFQQKELHEFSRENDIVLTAYAPLGSPGRRQHKMKEYDPSFLVICILYNFKVWYGMLSNSYYSYFYDMNI